ncbi:hypothetical protein [Phycicoccus sp.]|uniref:hypothetical protein n=1 Tax=Phycicoccus sp. TaxID=1902410 RepID=UPI002BCAAE6C|nr:hypothetical protein [Phycicoccus sp.]HMM95057.1 hypothetical protein [Phycicoccus sp.]
MAWLLDRYGARNPDVLRTVLGHAYQLGAQGAVLEYRYIDPDWRSEHSNLYAGTFRRYPSVTHRLHFFQDRIPAEAFGVDGLAGLADLGFLGYVVLRPVPAAPVGRVFLQALPDDDLAITCQATDQVNLLGEELSVRGTGFMAQDAMLLRCAHATLWTTAYHHHRQFGAPRALPGDITSATPELGLGRSVPSQGLDVFQMSGASESLGLPPLVYKVDDLPAGETLLRVACRYLNSSLPVIAVGGEHAWVLVGYRREGDGFDERIVFYRHDDEEGPYRRVEEYNLDVYAPWEYLLVPLPAKVYLPGEEAEAIGQTWLQARLEEDASSQARDVLQGLAVGRLSWRSSVHPSNRFKMALADRGIEEPVASIYRRTQLSRWVWIVEVVDRDLRRQKLPCVVADAVIDATDHPRDLRALLVRTPSTLTAWDPDRDSTRRRDDLTPQSPWSSASGTPT